MKRFRQPSQQELDTSLTSEGFIRYTESDRENHLPPVEVVKELSRDPTRERIALAIEAGHLTVSQAVDFSYRLGIIDGQKPEIRPERGEIPYSSVEGVPTAMERETLDSHVTVNMAVKLQRMREQIYLEQPLLPDGI